MMYWVGTNEITGMLLHNIDLIKDFTDYLVLLFWRGKWISST